MVLVLAPESEVVIRFPDCDPFHHLNNSRYLDYFLNAREDHLLEFYAFSIYQYTIDHKKGWVVGMNQIAYFRPAMLMEKVIIQSTVLELHEKDILVEMKMLDKNKSKVKALLWSRFFHIDLITQRSVAHGEAFMASFRPLVNPIAKQVSFEERAAEVRGG